MALIQAVKGPTPGVQTMLDQADTILGRHPNCQIVLDAAAVSRHHARIVREDGQFLIEDLGSRNGTLINGEKIEGRQTLQNGDRIVICDLSFDFFHNTPSEMLAGPALAEDSAMAFLVDDADVSTLRAACGREEG